MFSMAALSCVIVLAFAFYWHSIYGVTELCKRIDRNSRAIFTEERERRLKRYLMKQKPKNKQ